MSARKPSPAESAPHRAHILVVDDDRSIGECVQILLQRAGHACTVVDQGKDAMQALGAQPFDLVITDLRLPDASGLDIVGAAKQAGSDTAVILMTSFSSIESAIEALRKGANDYIIKPFDNDDFMFSVERALDERRTRLENAALKRNLKKVLSRNAIVGQSERIKRLLALIERVACTEANVLIQGESGTGKELVAQAIHFEGHRAGGPFVPVNCGAIPAELMESELFGHVKGAFTGAMAASDGLIQEASGGTLFLDEISELPLHLQVKLLRVIQERQVRPLGATQSRAVDTRFVAASNRNLKACAESGTFRADLYYRLNVITIHVPPLRERGGDIELLARRFMQQYARRLGKTIRGMGPDFLDFICQYDWPGNVRELQNVIERAVILADSDLLTCSELEEPVERPAAQPAAANRQGAPLSVEDYIKDIVLRYQDTHSEIALAAMLGIGRKALWVRRRNWGLYRDREPQPREPDALGSYEKAS